MKKDKNGHPEDYCNRCEQKNVCWSAPSDIWNSVMRDDRQLEYNGLGIICPKCFIELYEDKFGDSLFIVVPMNVMYPKAEPVGIAGR